MFVLFGFALIIIAALSAFNGDTDTAWKALILGNLFLIIFYIADLKKDVLKLSHMLKAKHEHDEFGDIVEFKDIRRDDS